MELSVSRREQDDELAALAHRVRHGDTGAFNTLASRVVGRVRAWATRITNDSDDADDVAQLVLLRLHARIDQFEGRSRITTWLYRITRNVAFTRAQGDRRREEILASRITDESIVPADIDQGDDGAQLADLVHVYFAELPHRQREVFELGDLRGLNSTEIGERLGITSSTARGLLMKARRRIRLRILESHAHLLDDYAPGGHHDV